jgi:signal transduction histidine kinase
VRLDDITTHPAYDGSGPPIRTFLGVSLRARRLPVGVLYVCDRLDGATFTDEDVKVAEKLGNLLGSALENTHLLRDAMRDRRWMRETLAMTRDLFAEDIEEPLRLICDRARELAEADVVMMLTVEDDTCRVRYARGLGTEGLLGQSYLTAGTWTARVLGTGHAEVTSDPMTTQTLGPTTMSGVELGPAMLLPLRGADHVRGALFLARYRESARFTEADLETAGGFADHAAVSLELAAARETTEQLRLMDERNRIARDLHDHVIQRLYATGMSLQRVTRLVEGEARERVEMGVSMIDETISQIRETIQALRTAEEAAAMTLGTLVVTIGREATPLLGFAPMIALEPPTNEISGPLAADLAACVREGLSNIARHAQAGSAELIGRIDDSTLTLTLRDDGVGIQSNRRSGLANLAQRAREHGGRFDVSSPPGGGTLLRWDVPLARRGD